MKKITEAIVLAGGFGTRLQHIVSDVPKPMAPINGTPFLTFIFKKLIASGIEHVILSTGYLHEKIEDYYHDHFENLRISYAKEEEPLGTGGAIRYALSKAYTEDVLVLNGDTLFNIDFDKLNIFYQEKKTSLVLALRKEKDVSRYGCVVTDKNNKVIAFTEKNEAHGEGLINGGIYLLNKNLFATLNLPPQFSFEKDVLENIYKTTDFYGLAFDDYFIDIGIEEDYKRAQIEFPLLKF